MVTVQYYENNKMIYIQYIFHIQIYFVAMLIVRNDSCHDDYGWKLDRNFLILRIFLKIELFNQKYMSSKATLD